jgi:hypothetical protein
VANDDHHDNRYEDGEELTGTVEDYDGWSQEARDRARERIIASGILQRVLRRKYGGTWIIRDRKADSTERP